MLRKHLPSHMSVRSLCMLASNAESLLLDHLLRNSRLGDTKDVASPSDPTDRLGAVGSLSGRATTPLCFFLTIVNMLV